jgi:DNA-binding NarL/FixJ family response regulator
MPSGIELELPRGPMLNRTQRQQRLRKLIVLRLSSPEITRRLGITRRTVTRNRSAMYLELEGKQLDRFQGPPTTNASKAP